MKSDNRPGSRLPGMRCAGASAWSGRRVLFARPPVPGKVKTRLIPTYGKQGACDIYLALLERSMQQHALLPGARFLACEAPHPVLTRLAARYGFSLCDQPAGNLGEKMRWFLRAKECTLITGSDCILSVKQIRQAMQELECQPVVLAPAIDGGYTLIGSNSHSVFNDAGVFRGVEWGTAAVLEQTVTRLKQRGVPVGLLGASRDVDWPEDVLYAQTTGWLPANIV